MKVLFIGRSTLFTNRGGDTVQITKTAEYLERIGISVDIRLTHEKINYQPYQLLHFFNIGRPADILYHMEAAHKPYVVSTIFVDYSEYDKKIRKGISGLLFRMLSPGMIEYAKVIARAILKNDTIRAGKYFFYGQSKSIKKIIQHASMLLPNSEHEYQRLKTAYQLEQRYKVIPNAADEKFLQPGNNSDEKDSKLLLCVARIEGIKNQINLIRAMNDTGYRLLLIGKAASNQKSYYEECRRIAAENIRFIDFLPQDQLTEYYKKARVHILPSWFETTGLSSLEAAAMRCNIVISNKGDTREYFEDYAYYCDPASPPSIYEAVKKAAESDFNESLRKKIITTYTWTEAAKKTKEAYLEIVGHNN